MLTLLLLAQLFSFTVVDNAHKLSVQVHTPETAVEIRVELWCEHLSVSSERPVKHRTETFDFANLHMDSYELYADIVKADGTIDHIERQVFITN